MKKRKTHSFTVTVTAPAIFTKSEIRREIRSNIQNHSAWLSGKYDHAQIWQDLAEGDIKVKSLS